MATIKPLKLDAANFPANAQTGDTVGLLNGGTDATTAAGARTNLGLAIGTDVNAYSADLTNLATLSTTLGIAVRTATNTWQMRSLTGSTRVGITNPLGTAGNPTIDLNAYTDSGAGSFLKLTRDSMGLVSGTTAVVTADITALVNGTYLSKAGDSMTAGFLTLFQDPTAAMHAATKQYVDLIASGYTGKVTVRAATTANVTLASAAPNVLDGVTLAANDLILVKDQSAGAENGIYKVTTLGTGANGVWTRDTAFDTSAEVKPGLFAFVSEGSTLADKGFTITTNATITLGTTPIVWSQTSGAGQITAGAGFTKTGDSLDIGTASSARIVVNADNIDLATLTITGWANGTTFYSKAKYDTYGRVIEVAQATAADVGAQASDAGLTSISTLTGAGGLYATATDTFVMRTLAGTAGRVTVTNGDGVAGAPTVDLAGSIVAPGSYGEVTVDQYGRVTAGSAGSAGEAVSTSMTNAEASAIVIGRAVYVFSSDNVKLANANAAGTRLVVGLVAATSINAAAAGNVATAGVLVATTGQWDVVTGQTGGLTPGSIYYLSNATAGALTTTAPSTGYSAPVGIAMSTTRMKINVLQTIQL